MFVTQEKAATELGFRPGPAEGALHGSGLVSANGWPDAQRGSGGGDDLEVKAIAAAFGKTGTCLDLGNTRLHLVAKGPGFRLARKALDSVEVQPDALVSTGICGALDRICPWGTFL